MNFTPERPTSYLITRGEATSDNFDAAKRHILDISSLAVEERVSMIQIREKRLSSRWLCELTEAVSKITCGTSTKLLVNNRADIAMACGADGVHLAASSINASEIRRVFGGAFLIGVSAHSLEEVVTASANGANFAVFAPVFASPSKGEPRGLEALNQICNAVAPFPVLALGGVHVSNVHDALDAGASGFAAIRPMNSAASLCEIMHSLRSV